MCTKSQLMSAMSIGSLRLQEIHPSNAVVIHRKDALKLGIKNGDRVRLISPGGTVEGVSSVRSGIQPGVIGIEHGYGHWGLGARREQVGNEIRPAERLRSAGVASNLLGISDPCRKGLSTLGDFVVGSNARHGMPVRIEKV